MNLIDRIEFANRLFLVDAKKHSKGINFKHNCAHGLDKKRRGYILHDHEKSTVFCHRCSMSVPLKQFLEVNDPSLFEEYRAIEKQEYIEELKTGKLGCKKQEFTQPINTGVPDDITLFKFNTKYFIPATESKECIEYCKKRKIDPTNLKFCTHPSNICSGMLIFPSYWKDGVHVVSFQGRSISEKRFYTHSKNPSFKVDNIFQVDLDKPVYIFESIIDRLSKTNSIAALGTDLSPTVLAMIKDPIFCLDSDLPAMKRSLRYAEANYKVFVWPNDMRAKDCNELLEKWNWSEKQIDKMITDNVYYGISAIVRLKQKMRNRKR